MKKKKVAIVDLEEIMEVEGVVAEDVVSQSLAVIIPSGTSLNSIKETQPKVVSRLSQHGIAQLKIRNMEKARLRNSKDA